MKNKILFLFLIFIVLSSLLDAAYLDTGYITWKQPDGTEFIAREWGDEFFNWFETDEGYAIIQDTDGWYYYSKLDNRGEFSPSNKIVGKHKPTGFVKHLKRSMERINYLSAKQNEINQHRLEKYNAYKSEHGSGSNAKNNGDNRITTVESIKLGVFLVDFQVSQRYDYGKHYYDDMLFSQNEYNGEGKREPYDDDPVFGSLNDYIIDQTNGHHDVVGKNGQPVIVNGTDPLDPTKVDWFVLAQDQAYYNNIPYEDTCWSEIMKEIEAEFGLAEIESYDEIGIMFAGDDVSNWFWPSVQNAVLSNGDKKAFFIVPENDRADGDNDFTHIGLVAHEFCHVAFGFFDEYDGQINPGNHCLMAYGENNGPANAGGACPAPINPGYKVDRGWVSPTTIPYDSFDYQIDEFDKIYKIEISGETSEYFLLLKNEAEGFFEYTPDYNKASQIGLTIWHWDSLSMFDYVDQAEIELPSSTRIKFPEIETEIDNFNDNTTPNSNKRENGIHDGPSNVAINNIVITDPHPTIMGIKIDVLDPTTYPAQPQGLSVVNSATASGGTSYMATSSLG